MSLEIKLTNVLTDFIIDLQKSYNDAESSLWKAYYVPILTRMLLQNLSVYSSEDACEEVRFRLRTILHNCRKNGAISFYVIGDVNFSQDAFLIELELSKSKYNRNGITTGSWEIFKITVVAHSLSQEEKARSILLGD